MPSEPPIPHEITELLHLWKAGDREALQHVVTLAYDDLRSIALGYLQRGGRGGTLDRKSTRLNSSHLGISYAVFCLKKTNNIFIYGHPPGLSAVFLLLLYTSEAN